MHDDLKFSDYIRPILIGTVCTLLISAIFTVILSFIMTKMDFPLGFSMPAAVVILGLSTLIGASVCARKFGQKGLFMGLCVALFMFTIVLLVNLSMHPQGFGEVAMIKGGVILISGIVGGVVGVNKQKNRIKI